MVPPLVPHHAFYYVSFSSLIDMLVLGTIDRSHPTLLVIYQSIIHP